MTEDEKAYGLLPTIEESLGDIRNERPKRSYTKDEVFVDELGYQRFRDTRFLVLNTDGSARVVGGRPSKNSEREASVINSMTRAQRRAERKERMLASKADIKQRDLLKRLDTNYFDCVGELLDIFEDIDTSRDQKLRILFKLMDHAYPKLSVLNTNEVSSAGFTFNINTGFVEESKEQQERKKELKKKLSDALQ